MYSGTTVYRTRYSGVLNRHHVNNNVLDNSKSHHGQNTRAERLESITSEHSAASRRVTMCVGMIVWVRYDSFAWYQPDKRLLRA